MSMGRATINASEIAILYNGQRCGTKKRIVFGDLGGWGIPKRPGMTGYVNYRGGHAKVHLNADGEICLESTEPLIEGLPPLRLTEW
jgi:hypothetical protein